MIVSRDEMLAIEHAAFQSGHTTAEALMDEVGRRMGGVIRLLAPQSGPKIAVVFAGKGNNAGDAFVAAADLRARGWHLVLRLASERAELGELAAAKLVALEKSGELSVWTAPALANFLSGRDISARGTLVVLDGLLGVGARGPLREPIKAAARELNALRRAHGAQVFALDLPSGVDADTGVASDPDAVVADVTLTVGYVKRGLVADAAVDHVGHLELIQLRELDDAGAKLLETASRPRVITRENLAVLLPPRAFESNKTDYGRIGIIAGAVGTTGAAVMCSLGALRAGAGLVTLLVHEKIYPTAAVTAAPEVMVKPVSSFVEALKEKFDVLAIGPGLSPEDDGDAIRTLIEQWPNAMVVDAGAITALAEDPSILSRCADPRLLTPHPGEMGRLWKGDPELSKREMKTLTRAEIVEAFTERYPAALLLKGARTIVGERGETHAYNSTGNPGMATGGMGDVLTGVCAAMIGQGLSACNAARMGAFICGRAAEMAVRDGAESEQSLIALDLPRYFGGVFSELRGTAA